MDYAQTAASLLTEIAEDLDVFGKDRIKLSNYMLRFLRGLSTGVAPNIRFQFTEVIPDSKVVSLPEDYGEYIMMAYIDGAGRLQEMSRNKKILQGGAASLSAANSQLPNQQQYLVGTLGYALQYGGTIGSDIRGLRPAAMYGTFDVDKKNGIINIQPEQYVPNLYMLYRSTCAEVSEEAFVHWAAQNAAILYTKYEYCRDRYNDGRYNKYKADLDKEMRKLPGLLNPLSLNDIIDSIDLVRGYMFFLPLLILNISSYF